MAAPPDHLFPDNDVSVMPVQEERQDERDEEEDRVHDPERPRRLQHRAVLVDVYRPRQIAVDAEVAKGAQADVDGRGGEIGAVRIADAAQLVVGGDEGTDEAEVDEGDEEGGAAGGAEAEEGRDRPGAGEDGDDEEDEDVGWREFIYRVVARDEP